jgi:hypothetical protein
MVQPQPTDIVTLEAATAPPESNLLRTRLSVHFESMPDFEVVNEKLQNRAAAASPFPEAFQPNI